GDRRPLELGRVPDEAREIRDTHESARDRVDRKHAAAGQPDRTSVLDYGHPWAGAFQVGLQAEFFDQRERVAIGARDQLRAQLDHIAVTGFATDAAADTRAGLEHRHV